MEDLAIRKVSPATLKAYWSDLVAVSALLGAHDGGWPVAELVGPVLRPPRPMSAPGGSKIWSRPAPLGRLQDRGRSLAGRASMRAGNE